MLILMQNYEIFTKIIVLQETRSKEAKRARKTAEKTKEGRTIVATKQKAKARKIVATFKLLSRQNLEEPLEGNKKLSRQFNILSRQLSKGEC